MEKTLMDYDQSLEALEKQREELELVMQRMGKEWEESGAGIGWLGALNLPSSRESSSTSGPSAEYLGSLLNVNEDLLAQSLANTTTPSPAPHHPPASIPGIPLPLATPSSESILTTTTTTADNNETKRTSYVTSPPITPDESLLKGAINEPPPSS
ncbi:hypothetical protein K492DRAFT_149781 [Lichtheimia hyalospora FSU 10163]|nr:hypothetical protein K492DRAFT_149781 [Lichtheimia hyalospora FSU 10163]